jgi:cytochrome c-type biogenesis protein CcmF
MIASLGKILIVLSFLLSLYTIFGFLVAISSRQLAWAASAKRAVYANGALLTLTSALLLYAFLSHDFSIEYVYRYSDRNLPLFYLISAFWAGQSGSLLLWTWVLAIFAVITTYQHRENPDPLFGYAGTVLTAVLCFFTLLMIASDNPFRTMGLTPADGQGLNPLLQHPMMVFHPPALYLGYVGFTVPFAFAIAALILNRSDHGWISISRRWAIFSWFFLSMGNILGAMWAYVELGWGGYWAWDPVENAAFIPWLAGTAYLHSVMIQERRGMLKVWNHVLIIATFATTIIGTFITRSGIISSVHSFAQSTIGIYFLVFLALILTFSILLLYIRLPSLKPKHNLESFLSKESTFLLNNIIFLGATFAILWGTLFPLFSEVFTGHKVVVGPQFYNRVMEPLGLILLLLMGIGPKISWRKATIQNVERHFLVPLFVFFITIGVLLFLGLRQFYPLLYFSGCAFVITTIVTEVFQGIRARKNLSKESTGTAIFNLILGSNRRYGGYIIHLGIVLIIFGIAGSYFNHTKEFTLDKGEEISVGNYKIKFDKFVVDHAPAVIKVAAKTEIEKNNKPYATIFPAKFFYSKNQQPTTEVDINSTLKEDLYLILLSFSPDTGEATFKAIISPLVIWIWIGGILLIFGTIVVMLPRLRLPQPATRKAAGRDDS